MAFILQSGPATKQNCGKHIFHAISALGVPTVTKKPARTTQKSSLMAKKKESLVQKILNQIPGDNKSISSFSV